MTPRPTPGRSTSMPRTTPASTARCRRLRHEVYGEDLGQTGWRTAAEQVEIEEWLRLGPRVRVLDVCCGSGGPSLALAERTGCHVTGIDLEAVGVGRAKAAAMARGVGGQTEFLAADGGRLPFADGTFEPSPASMRSTTSPAA